MLVADIQAFAMPSYENEVTSVDLVQCHQTDGSYQSTRPSTLISLGYFKLQNVLLL